MPNNQMSNDKFFLKIIFNKQPTKRVKLNWTKVIKQVLPYRKIIIKNNKVEYLTIEQFKNQIIWIKYGIKTK